MTATSQRMLNGIEPGPSPKGWVLPLLGERLPCKNIPANPSPRLTTPTPQLAECAKTEHHEGQIDANGSKQARMASPSTEDKPAQHRGRSRTRHHPRSGTVSHTPSRGRLCSPAALAGLKYGKVQCASSQQPSAASSAGLVTPRPHVASRFSYEDYKHVHVMGWLEEGLGGKQVGKTLVPILASLLTVAEEMSRLAYEVVFVIM
jgi:hypothetical protein